MAEPVFEARKPGSKAHTLNPCTSGDIPLPKEVWEASKKRCLI